MISVPKTHKNDMHSSP